MIQSSAAAERDTGVVVDGWIRVGSAGAWSDASFALDPGRWDLLITQPGAAARLVAFDMITNLDGLEAVPNGYDHVEMSLQDGQIFETYWPECFTGPLVDGLRRSVAVTTARSEPTSATLGPPDLPLPSTAELSTVAEMAVPIADGPDHSDTTDEFESTGGEVDVRHLRRHRLLVASLALAGVATFTAGLLNLDTDALSNPATPADRTQAEAP